MAEEKELQDLIEFLKSPKQQVYYYRLAVPVGACSMHMCMSRMSATSVLSRFRRRQLILSRV